MTKLVLAASIGALTLGVSASAHHSFAAAYFEDQKITIAGEVVRFDYVNPHAWVHVMVREQGGDMRKYSAEWSNPRRLKQQGLAADAIKPGDQVVVTGGGEVLQTASANISTTITGKQIHELPFSTRDALQLVLVMPGVQTPGTSRTSSVNGLPTSSLNITVDGANVQDNFLKSTDGFFTSVQPKSDAVEELTVSTATPGAESAPRWVASPAD